MNRLSGSRVMRNLGSCDSALAPVAGTCAQMGESMTSVVDIRVRPVFNSHVNPTTEYVVVLASGHIGTAAPSHGETVGIYEDQSTTDATGASSRPTSSQLPALQQALVGPDWTQESWDAALETHQADLGQNTTAALSEAFFNAERAAGRETPAGSWIQGGRAPRLCCNVLNGGWHAYTNPVLSEYHEYILVARSRDIHQVVAAQSEIQAKVAERLAGQPKQVVAGNTVNRFTVQDNRACLEFLLDVRDASGMTDDFDLMIDASAGDLWTGSEYANELTTGRRQSSEDLIGQWASYVEDYGLAFLEDPFHERDFASWRALTAAVGDRCVVVGDNFYSTNAGRILDGARHGYANGAIIKPNQAGSVTASRAAVAACQETGQVVITSHRSVSTESTFVSWLSVHDHADAIKVGPLATDYSSVVRLNEILRLSDPL